MRCVAELEATNTGLQSVVMACASSGLACEAYMSHASPCSCACTTTTLSTACLSAAYVSAQEDTKSSPVQPRCVINYDQPLRDDAAHRKIKGLGDGNYHRKTMTPCLAWTSSSDTLTGALS